MNAFGIKILAAMLMVLDHIGVFVLPEAVLLRVVGRISFPLFAWLLANGAHHTRDMKSYLKRLLVFAAISQIPYAAAYQLVSPGVFKLNVMFTLFFGLTGIYLYKTQKSRLWGYMALVVVSVTGQITKSDYGFWGVMMTGLFYIFYENKLKMAAAASLLTILETILTVKLIPGFVTFDGAKIIALTALPIIWFYNQKEGRKMKYWFYVFYPVQFGVFYLYNTGVDTLLKADIFFFISSVVSVVLGTMVCVLLYYLIKAGKNLYTISEALQDSFKDSEEFVVELKERLEDNPVFRFFFPASARRLRLKEKSGSLKK